MSFSFIRCLSLSWIVLKCESSFSLARVVLLWVVFRSCQSFSCEMSFSLVRCLSLLLDVFLSYQMSFSLIRCLSLLSDVFLSNSSSFSFIRSLSLPWVVVERESSYSLATVVLQWVVVLHSDLFSRELSISLASFLSLLSVVFLFYSISFSLVTTSQLRVVVLSRESCGLMSCFSLNPSIPLIFRAHSLARVLSISLSPLGKGSVTRRLSCRLEQLARRLSQSRRLSCELL